MTDHHPEKSIFLSAIEMGSYAERAQYLDKACEGNQPLRDELEALLQAHEKPQRLLDAPVVELPSPLRRQGQQLRDSGTVDEPSREPSGTVIGPYKLLQQIGEGGMGTVYMAEQSHPVQRKVALKVIKAGMDSGQVIARFEAERQALALMDHPNIAKVLDAGTTAGGRPYFVMELVKGVPITRYCDENHLPPKARLELFTQVCHAVQHAHQKGIIHRDIKPTNVLVTLYDDKPVPKVIDFGVAKATGGRLTERTVFTGYGQIVGTLEYMSPEQARFNALDIDTRGDIYSLGVLLYELLTGTTPFDKKRLREAAFDEMLRMIREEEPPRPSTRLSTTEGRASIAANRSMEPNKLCGLVRGELDWIVMKALEKDRNRRYETASSLAMDLQRYLADESVQACPPSAAYRFHKLVRRNRGMFAAIAAAALVMLMGVVGLAVSNVLIIQEKNQKEIALKEKEEAFKAAKSNYQEAIKQQALAKDNEKIANEQRQEAQANLKDALAAVDQMLTRVSEERLRNVPQMEPVRRDLLQDALRFYQKFLEKRSDDSDIRRETALAYWNMGSLHYQLGDYESAEAAYRRVFAMFDRLEAEAPLEPAIRSKLVVSHLGFARILRNQGKFKEEDEALRRAVALAEYLLNEFPDVPLYRSRLVEASNRLAEAIAAPGPLFVSTASPLQLKEAESIVRRNLTLIADGSIWHRAHTCQNLSNILAKQCRFLEAEETCREAVKYFEKAAASSPQLQSQIELAIALQQLARLLDANGRPQDADAMYQRAIPVFDRFAADFPTGPHHRWGQADIHFQHALLLSKLRRSAEAEQAFRRTVELFDKLANDFPTITGYRSSAVHRRDQLAQFLANSGRVPEAKQVYVQAGGMLQDLAAKEKSEALVRRGHFYAGLGEWDKAVGDFSQAIELGSNDLLGAWCPLAVGHLGADRIDEYRTHCERLLDRFGQTESHWLVATCVLAPQAVSDPSPLVQIAEKLVAREPQNGEYLATLGLALYRNGDWESASQKLEASFHSGSKLREVYLSKTALAMTYHRLGRTVEAREMFQEVEHWMKETPPEKRGLNTPLPWAYRLSYELLHREVEELLKQGSP